MPNARSGAPRASNTRRIRRRPCSAASAPRHGSETYPRSRAERSRIVRNASAYVSGVKVLLVGEKSGQVERVFSDVSGSASEQFRQGPLLVVAEEGPAR